jgi:hypothetical protein
MMRQPKDYLQMVTDITNQRSVRYGFRNRDVGGRVKHAMKLSDSLGRHALIGKESDDMPWLFSTHLKAYPQYRYAKSAVLTGNEDSPNKIELYDKLDPLVTDKPLASFNLSDDGAYVPSPRVVSPMNVHDAAVLLLKKLLHG